MFLLDTRMEKGQFGFMKRPYESHEGEYRRMKAAGTGSWFRRNRPWDIDPHDKRFLEDVFAQPWAPQNGRAVELGCGTGPLTRWLARRGFKTTGVDISRTAIRMAREQSGNDPVDYRVADICTSAIHAPGKFVLCVDGRFFQSITNPKDRKAVLANVRRWLKPEGVFVLMSMCAPIERRHLARQYPTQKILRNVIYYPLQRRGGFSEVKTFNGGKFIPVRFVGHWKCLLQELHNAGRNLCSFGLIIVYPRNLSVR